MYVIFIIIKIWLLLLNKKQNPKGEIFFLYLIYIYTLSNYTFIEYGTILFSSTFFSTWQDNFLLYSIDFFFPIFIA